MIDFNFLNKSNLNNCNKIVNILSNDFNIQKNLINNINAIINLILLQNKQVSVNFKNLNINNNLPFLISELGIPFCDLLYNNKTIFHYVNNYTNDKSDAIKSILMNFIKVFNFKSIESTPADKIIELIGNYDNDIKEMDKEKRNEKTEIEEIYDNLNSTINKITNNKDYNKEQYKLIIKEYTEIVNKLKNSNKYPNATIQFLREKISNIENYINKVNNLNIIPNLININNNSNEHNNYNNGFPFFNQNNFFNNFNIIKNNINNFSPKNANNQEELNRVREIPLKDREFFYKDEELKEGEDEFIEFKNYSYPFSQDKIDELKRQYCGFLNNHGGRIYLGINDLRIVKGIKLDYKSRDTIRNELINYTYDFYPKCRINNINIYFIPIKSIETKKPINNLFVIQIIVLPGEPYNLYSLTNKGGFISAIRLPGQCINLTAEEIYSEIMKRGELLKAKYIQQYKEEGNDSDNETNANNHGDITDNNDDTINEESVESNDDTEDNKAKIIYVVKITNIDTSLKIKDINKFFNTCKCSYQKFPSKDGKSEGNGEIHFSKKENAKSFINNYNKIKLCGRKEISMKLTKRKIFN